MSNGSSISERLLSGKYLDKHWDWNAFPANAGFPVLERAQMRYIGAGGSPKTDDVSTLKPGAFTCSLIFQEPGRKASVHHHRIEELFFMHQGELTMSWQFGDETVDFIVGPGDAILNPTSRPHGFSNHGTTDCIMQIMVATAAPMSPTYTDHPSDYPISPLKPAAPDLAADYMREVERYVVRGKGTKAITAEVDGGTFVARPYVMNAEHGGIVTPSHFTYAVNTLSRGAITPVYALSVEEALMTLDGILDVEIYDGEDFRVDRFGPRDLALIPAGVKHRLVNRDAATARFGAIVGDKDAGPFGWHNSAS